jgi:hypothetical protein
MDDDFGTYGVLRKKDDDSFIVANYPIDDEAVTFGKESNCSIRLYYPAVSLLHAKLIFQERKARQSLPSHALTCLYINRPFSLFPGRTA